MIPNLPRLSVITAVSCTSVISSFPPVHGIFITLVFPSRGNEDLCSFDFPSPPHHTSRLRFDGVDSTIASNRPTVIGGVSSDSHGWFLGDCIDRRLAFIEATYGPPSRALVLVGFGFPLGFPGHHHQPVCTSGLTFLSDPHGPSDGSRLCGYRFANSTRRIRDFASVMVSCPC